VASCKAPEFLPSVNGTKAGVVDRGSVGNAERDVPGRDGGCQEEGQDDVQSAQVLCVQGGGGGDQARGEERVGE